MGKSRSSPSKTAARAAARGSTSPPKVQRHSGTVSSPSYASDTHGLKKAPTQPEGANSVDSSVTSAASLQQKAAKKSRPDNPYVSAIPADLKPTPEESPKAPSPANGPVSHAKYPPSAPDPPSPNKKSTGAELPESVTDPMEIDASESSKQTTKTRFHLKFAHKVVSKNARSGDTRKNAAMIRRWWREIKKVDPTIVLLPWRTSSSNDPIAGFEALKDNALEQPFTYFNKGVLSGARENGYVSLWLDVYLQHSKPVAKLEELRSKSKSNDKVTMWRRVCQSDQRIKYIGFLPYTDRRMDFKRVAAILSEKIMIPLDIRWKELQIQPGMEKTDHEVPSSQVLALCVGAPVSQHGAVPEKLFTLLNREGFKPLGLKIMYVSYPSKDPRVARMPGYDMHLAGHHLWCRKLRSTAVDGIKGLHKPLTENGPTLNDLIMQRVVQWGERKVGNPLLASVGTAWYSEESLIFSYLDTHQNEAEGFVSGSTVCRWLLEKFPQYKQQIESRVAADLVTQASSLIWDPNLEAAVPADVAMDTALLADPFKQDLSPLRGSQDSKPSGKKSKKSKKSTTASRSSNRSSSSRSKSSKTSKKSTTSKKSKRSKTSKGSKTSGKVPGVIDVSKSDASNMSVDSDDSDDSSLQSERSSRSVASSVLSRLESNQALADEQAAKNQALAEEREARQVKRDLEREQKELERDKEHKARQAEYKAELDELKSILLTHLKSSQAQGAAGPAL